MFVHFINASLNQITMVRHFIFYLCKTVKLFGAGASESHAFGSVGFDQFSTNKFHYNIDVVCTSRELIPRTIHNSLSCCFAN